MCSYNYYYTINIYMSINMHIYANYVASRVELYKFYMPHSTDVRIDPPRCTHYQLHTYITWPTASLYTRESFILPLTLLTTSWAHICIELASAPRTAVFNVPTELQGTRNTAECPDTSSRQGSAVCGALDLTGLCVGHCS